MLTAVEVGEKVAWVNKHWVSSITAGLLRAMLKSNEKL